MTPERYKEVSRLYRAALELEPTRWTDYLADACGGDEALRQEVESLLAYEAHDEKWIDQPAIETVAKAGIAVGVDGIFIETHFDPANAKSDGANMLHLDYFEDLMKKLVAIRKTINQF